MRLKDIAESRKDFFMMAPGKIKIVPDFNVRMPSPDLDDHIHRLMLSIQELGILEPLTIRVENEEVLLVNGHCRLEAVKRLRKKGCPIEAVPCRVEERGASEADAVLSMIVRNSGLPLTVMERAEVFKRLLRFGWTTAQIAKRSGYSQVSVAQHLRTLEAPDELKQLVTDGLLSATTVNEATECFGQDAADIVRSLSEQKGGGRVTRRELQAVAKSSDVPRKPQAIKYYDRGAAKAAMTEKLLEIEALVKGYKQPGITAEEIVEAILEIFTQGAA